MHSKGEGSIAKKTKKTKKPTKDIFMAIMMS